jgi:hypothetical protein
LAAAWLTAKRKLRTAWLDHWMRADPSHTLEYAKRAQHMLLVADLFSLWLCCDAPAGAGQDSILGQSAMKLQTNSFLNQFHFSVPEFKLSRSADADRIDSLRWSIAVSPYPFKTGAFSLSARSMVAPAVRYATWPELAAASRPAMLEWRLVEGTPAVGPAA